MINKAQLIPSVEANVIKPALELWRGNDWSSWITFAAVAAGICLFAVLAKSLVAGRMHALAKKTSSEIDDFVAGLFDQTKLIFIASLSVYIATQFLNIDDQIDKILRNALIVIFLYQLWQWGKELIRFAVVTLMGRDDDLDTSRETIEGTVPAIVFVGKLILFSIILLLALDNFGFDVTTLVASLGIGGIAIALAVQNVLSDVFASLSILLDKPFKVGDFIIVGDLAGNVEKIGIKTTRLKSLSGEQLVFSNNDLLSSRIRNYKRMEERRIVFKFGVIYQTASAQLKKVQGIVKEIIESEERARFDRAHFFAFGDSSLDFEVVYFVQVPDYNVYMDIQQSINLKLYERFEKEGIDFAYPTRTIFIENESALEKAS